MFQSPPSPKAGSYTRAFQALRSPGVSIPSQPEGRELHRRLGLPSLGYGFNPLPARRPGATKDYSRRRYK